MTALIIATALLASGCAIFHCGTNFRGGAGAPGSILMLIGAATVVVSIFVFGVATGLLVA